MKQTNQSAGMAWVTGQMLLIAAAGVAGPWWPGALGIPFGRSIGTVCFLYAAWTGLSGVRHLKRNLTPMPVPRSGGQLVTTGIYGFMRHPLYSAMMAMGLGWAAMWSSLPAFIIAVLLGIFLHAKTLYEERLLRLKFPDYPGYAARVPRYFPKLNRPTRADVAAKITRPPRS
jgi:protein-S-isoprenylcysteine O-methyltransferase Ste14